MPIYMGSFLAEFNERRSNTSKGTYVFFIGGACEGFEANPSIGRGEV
jgi:hypothetical protein